MPRIANRRVLLIWLVGWPMLGAGLLWSGVGGFHEPQPALSDSVQAAAVAAPPKYLTKAIQELQVGDRVLADNPEIEDPPPEPNWRGWRQLELRMEKPDGGQLDLTLLRPADWIAIHGAIVGAMIELDLPEMGAAGPAEVVKVGACPQILPGSGRVITGVFRHTAGNVIDVLVDGADQPIGTTANHPFWSEDRQTFIPAGELRIGEHLRTPEGSLLRVASVTPRSQGEPVFNLEVDAEHVYYVSEHGVLVHNTYAGNHAYRAAKRDLGIPMSQQPDFVRRVPM